MKRRPGIKRPTGTSLRPTCVRLARALSAVAFEQIGREFDGMRIYPLNSAANWRKLAQTGEGTELISRRAVRLDCRR